MCSSQSSILRPAIWRLEFLSHISKMSSPEFVFSSLHPAPPGYQVPYLPRARTCIYRGMWAELPTNRHNPAELNEKVFQSDLLTLTTDVRMAKISEIFASAAENGNVSMSGGGGPVEAVFWIKETGTQWRFKGEAFIIGKDIDNETSNGAKLVKKKIGERMRVIKDDGKEQWSWGKELTAHFGNLSPVMRGTFKNPTPGDPVSIPVPDKRLALGQKVDDLHDEVARDNFRVVIIKPNEVEKLDLSHPGQGQRMKYTFLGSNNTDMDEWRKEEVWP